MRIQPIVTAALVWMILGLAACTVNESSGDGSVPIGPSVPFSVIAAGGSSGIASERLQVLRDESSFSALWASHDLTLGPANTEPSVDFGQEMVIAVFLGAKPSSGYSIDISKIEDGPNNIAVTVSIGISRCLPVAQVITQPYMIVKTARSSKIVTFNESVQVPNCQ